MKVDVRKISTAGGYNPVARPGSKGDTLSVPHVPDPENLDDRGTVIHELTHAGQDAAEKPSPLRRLREPKDLEQEAYTVEADYELKQLAKLSDAKARATAIGQLVKTWGGERSGAMAVATKKDPKLLPMAQELSKAVRKINKKVADEFDALLAGEEGDAVRALRAAIKPSIVAEIDGLAGETDLDTSATFSSGKAAVSRRVETTYGIRFARFKVGVELTTELAHAGWAATVGGPLDDAGLRKLHAIALSHWGSTIDDNERMFMAALMNAENAKSLHLEHPYGFFADDQISFTAASITAANRTSSRTSGATTGRRTAATPTQRTSRATPGSSTARSARWPARSPASPSPRSSSRTRSGSPTRPFTSRCSTGRATPPRTTARTPASRTSSRSRPGSTSPPTSCGAG